jgi:hypothetical protein
VPRYAGRAPRGKKPAWRFCKQYAVSLGRFFGRILKREGGLRSRLRRRRQVAAQKNPAAGSGNHLAVAADDLAAIEGAAL